MKKLILIIVFCLMLIGFSWGSLLSSQIQQQRIISLAPSTTEILFSLGLDEEIVGVSTFCNYPARAQDKEKVGTFSQPNIEKIISLRPDLILATGLEQAAVVERLRRLGLKVYVSDPANIEELFASIKEIGRLTQREKAAQLLIEQMQAKIERIQARVKLMPPQRPRVFIEIWPSPLMTAGRGSFVDELITLAGGDNIAADTPRPYSYFSVEQVIKRNPDIIILGYMVKKNDPQQVQARWGWEEVNAVKNKRICSEIDPDLFLRPGPRLAEGLEQIHRQLYP